MDTRQPGSSAPSTDTPRQSAKPGIDPIDHNIESILAFYAREEQNVTRSQRILETILDSLGRPIYLCVIVLFCLIWVLANVWLELAGLRVFDEPPFHWLQGLIGLVALLIMIVILIKQNRIARIEERRAHLELQVNLLTEHKTAKLIKLIMELRRDLPMCKNRTDPEAELFQRPTDPEAVLAAIDERFDADVKRGEAAPGKSASVFEAIHALRDEPATERPAAQDAKAEGAPDTDAGCAPPYPDDSQTAPDRDSRLMYFTVKPGGRPRR